MIKLVLCLLICVASYGASHHPLAFIEKIKDTPDEAAQIYQAFCQNCHAPQPIIPLGAPKIGVNSDWIGRKELLKNTLQGIGLMPARGGCFECTDEQLKKTIDYMVNYKD